MKTKLRLEVEALGGYHPTIELALESYWLERVGDGAQGETWHNQS